MAKRRREEVSGGTMAEEDYYTLFIDTSLDTHLATIISGSATVSDVKKKIVLEHAQLFPSIGEIKILSLQVKRQGHFYHLADSMLVVNAYEGSKRHKSLFVEASASEHDKEKDTCEPEIKGRSSSEVSDHDIVGVETTLDHDGQSIPTMKKRQKEASQDHVETSPSDANATPGVLRTSYSVLAAEKCHLLLPSEEVAIDPTAELGANSRISPMKHQSTTMEDLASPIITASHDKNKVSIQTQGQGIHIDTLDSVAIHVDEDRQKGLALDHDCQVMPSASYKPSDQSDTDRINNESIVGPKGLETVTPIETLISDGAKRKKRAKKKPSVAQTDSIGEQSKASGPSPNSSAFLNLDAENLIIDNTDKNNCMLPQTENHKSNLVEVEKGHSANEDLEEKLPEFFKPAGQGEVEVANKEVILSPTSLHPIEAMKAVHSAGNKRKKRKTKESAAKIQDKMKMENQLSTFRGISPLAQDVVVHNQMTDNDKKSESDLHSLGTGQIGKIAGDSEESLKQNKIVIPAESKPLESGGTNANTLDSVSTIVMSDAKDLKTGSQRKKRRTKLSTEMEETKSKNDLSNVTDRPVNVVMDEAMNAQMILTEDVGKKVSESMDVSASVIQRKDEKVIELLPLTEVYQNQENAADMDENVKEVVKNNQIRDNNGGANVKPAKGQPDDFQDLVLEQSGRFQENDSNLNKREKKKRKKGQIYAAEKGSNLETKNHKIGVEESAVSGEILKGMDSQSKTAKIGKPTDGGAAIQSNVPSFEIEKDAGTEFGCSIPEPAQIVATSNEVPLKGRPGTWVNDQVNLETAKCEDEGINFKRYFVPGQPQNEIGSSVKVQEASRSMKSKKNKDKHYAATETPLKLSEPNEKGKPSDSRNANDNKLEESTKKQNEELQMANKKTSIASQDGVKAPTTSDVAGNKALKKSIKPAVASGSQGSRAVPARREGKKGSSTTLGLSSKSKGPGKVQKVTTAKHQPSFNINAMATRKYSSNGSLLKSSGREKNLLTTERKLFTSSGSSDDENKMLNSDSSTRTPSDNSSSSGSSAGESDSSLDSKQKESEDAKTKAGAGKNNSSKKFSAQHMTMDEVLKSSSRFKKAKLTASQSQDGDTENWPDDTVPDSQANV